MSRVNARILNKVLTTDVDFTLPPNEDYELFEGWDETALAPGEIGINSFRSKAYMNTGEEIVTLSSPVDLEINTNNEGSFDSGTTIEVNLIDEDTNPVSPVSVDVTGQVVTIELPNAKQGEWVRSPDWLPLPDVTYGDEVFYGLWAIYEDEKSVCSIQSYNTSLIDWGDGTSQATLNNVQYTKVYDYASIVCDVKQDKDGRNYKQVIVQIDFSGNDSLWIDRNNASEINNNRVLGWLDISIDMASLTRFGVCEAGKSSLLERLVIYNGNINFANQSWQYLSSLRILQMDNFNSGLLSNSFYYMGDARKPDNTPLDLINTTHTFTNNAFAYTQITEFGDVSLDLSGNNSGLFSYNYGLKSIGTHYLPLATTIANYLFGCTSLSKTGVFTTSSSLTSISQAFYDCLKLKEIELTDCSGITTTTNAFYNCVSLKSLILTGITRGFNITDCSLDADALDELFTSLGTASGSQTITITRNPGVPTCDTSIATGKGFTIVS